MVSNPVAQRRRASETNPSQTPRCIIDALGLGDPLLGCVSAWSNSVSPGRTKCTGYVLIEHSPCLKISGARGLAPEDS